MTPPAATVVLLYQRTSLPWIFESAERAGVRLVLVPRPDEEPPPEGLPPAVTEVLPLDVERDRAGALEALRRRHEAEPFDGVLTLYDPLVPFAARAAETLGLPGIGYDTALGAQDKRIMRQRLAAAGLNTPRFVSLDGPGALAEAARLRYPVVVKPARGYSSFGVVRADTPDALGPLAAEVSGYCRERLDDAGSLLVEEYLDGPEYAVESLAHRGRVRVLTIGYKGRPEGPYFEESVYRAPAPLPAAVQEAVRREVTAAHAALGITDGPTHTELRLCDGTPYLLEMGARIGGSGVSHHIVRHVTGVDLAAEALRIAAGLAPESFGPGPSGEAEGLARATGAAGNYIVPCGGSGRIAAVRGLDAVRADPRVDHVVQMLFPGDVVRPYPDFTGYPAFVLSHHGSAADGEEFHRALARDIRIDYAPEEAVR
ncbi:ATP-grasp domain-containing protein [Streptomyces sp. TRM 70351]|uniref:ATP-grasp domain-containing protein n=1 Tax=Streptomyces sp. TRM 70351 TaxID=3116552 RepID=UPI002E7BAF5F|nr:ATP-grasp domain-containing protein [Streptomyces sp. TRM 70351]MEE1930126.1 ATP-grasp domain-containing protein [Streptomyces sp. TRM 70351]